MGGFVQLRMIGRRYAHRQGAAVPLPVVHHAQQVPILLVLRPIGPRHEDELLAEAVLARAPVLELPRVGVQAPECLCTRINHILRGAGLLLENDRVDGA